MDLVSMISIFESAFGISLIEYESILIEKVKQAEEKIDGRVEIGGIIYICMYVCVEIDLYNI